MGYWDWGWELGIGNGKMEIGNGKMGMGKWEMGKEYRQSQEMTRGHHPPTTTQLLTMKDISDNKVPLVKMSQDDPLYPSSKKNYQVDSDNNNLGEYK